jgi:hypothetical protein
MESSNSSKNFLKHVFNFNDDSKSDILNIIQYSLIAIIPLIILNKSISRYIPEVDEKKASLEILIEVVIQILIMFLGLLIIHRIITFIPTFSSTTYPDFHIIYIVLSVLMITMSLQTKLGEKVNILVERTSDFWNGKEEKVTNKNIKVRQPISGQITGKPMPITDNTAIKQSLYSDGTAISSLPTNDTNYNQNTSQPQEALPDYNKMYQQNTTPLVNANSPNDLMQEPMAANSLLGSGSGFGSW